MDVATAVRRVEPMLGEVEPALAAEQGADLCHTQIIVGIGKREGLDQLPSVGNDEAHIEQPGKDQHPPPVAEEHVGHLCLQCRKTIVSHPPTPPNLDCVLAASH